VTEAFRWPNGYRAAACFTFDVDAESPILFEYPEAAGWLDVMTHQAYGPRTGLPRILRILARQRVRATFFVPGYTAERWPDVIPAIRDGGHEIACHGYLHEGSRGADEALEERRLLRALEALERFGVKPTGYRAPDWEASFSLPGILARHGFRYDSSLMDSDWPYRLAVSADSDAAPLVELPVHWSLDDWEPYTYLPGISGSGLIASPSELIARWTLELEALVDEGGLFMLTNHPFISGRASRAAGLERLIARAREIAGLWVASCEEIATHVETLDLEPVVHRPPDLPA
jgi:peptidoglycan-N-acetylglucosamine deacetylase